MKTSLLLIGIIILSGFIPAFGDSIPYWGEPFNKSEPTICIFEPSEEIGFNKLNLLNITKYAIWEWQYRLMLYTGENNWGFNIEYYDKDSDKNWWKNGCNISITYEEYFASVDKDQLVHTKSGDATLFDIKGEEIKKIRVFTHNVIKVEFTEELEIVNVDRIIQTPNFIRLVALHELGHGFGLDHLIVECTSFCMSVDGGYSHDDAMKSIMYWSIRDNDNDFISDKDLGAIVQLYSEDGWGDHNRDGLKLYWWDASK